MVQRHDGNDIIKKPSNDKVEAYMQYFIITRLINFNDAISIMASDHAHDKHFRTIQIFVCRIYIVYTYFIEHLPDDETKIVSKLSYEFNTMFKTLFVFNFILKCLAGTSYFKSIIIICTFIIMIIHKCYFYYCHH